MSIYLSDVAITEFDSMVKAVYQSSGFKLRGAAYTKSNVKGQTVSFPVQQKGMAKQKATQDDVVPMNIDYDPITVNMQNWYAADYSDIFDQAEVNFDDKKYLAIASAEAIGRISDQIQLDALEASGTSNTIAAGGTGFTYAKYLEMNEFFSSIGVNRDEQRYVAVSSAAERDLLNEDKFINRDYTTANLLSDGRLDGKSVMGYNWIVIPDNAEGGLAAGETYAWAERAMGFATGIDMRTSISYQEIKTSWLVNTIFKACSVAIDPTGIVTIGYVA